MERATVLITDLENSTWLWEHHPDVMEDAVTSHLALVASLVEPRGRIVKSTGDGVLALFDDPAEAIEVAAGIQRQSAATTWPSVGTVPVRIGVSTGSCRLTDNDVLGPTPNLAARLQSVGHGGQVLVAESTARECAERLPRGFRLLNLGPHIVRSFDEPVVIHMATAEGLRSEFPPLRVRYSGLDDLPPDDDELIGRDGLLVDVAHLVRDQRLVTLWGPAGVGKTRVAVRLASTARRPFDDGMRFVDLSAVEVDEADEVVRAILASVRAQAIPDERAIETARRVLGAMRLLVIVDNCERALTAVSSVLAVILRSCRGVHVLATSREPVGLRAEVPVEVTPLPVPPARWSSLAELDRSPAVRMFVARAAARQPGFTLSEATAPAVVAACRATDGLPLALELASARVGVEGLDVDPGALLELLAGSDLAASLTRTLGTIDGPTSALFARLSVFDGPFDRGQALGLAHDPARSNAALDRLVRAAVVQRDAQAGRYRVLAPFREVGRRRLGAADMEVTTAAHADMMLERAEAHAELMRGPREAEAIAAITAEFADHRAAIRLQLERSLERAARHAGALFLFCTFQARPEGHEWVRRVAARTGGAERWASEILGAAALAAWYAGDSGGAIRLAMRSVEATRPGGVDRWARIALVNAYSYSGDLAAAVPHYIELVAAARRDEPFWQVHGLGLDAVGMAMSGNIDAAIARAERALAVAGQLGNPDCRQWALYALGRALASSEPAAACEAFEEAMRSSASVGSRFHVGLNLVEWIALKRRLGEHAMAVGGLLDLLDLLAMSANRSQLSQALLEVGLLLAAAGRHEEAAVALLARRGLPAMPVSDRAPRDEADATMDELAARLGSTSGALRVRAAALSEPALLTRCREQLREVRSDLASSSGS